MNTIPLVNLHQQSDGLTRRDRLELVKENPMFMDIVCQRVAEGDSLRQIARDEMLPYGLFQLWIAAEKTRMEAYRNAERLMAGALVHDAIERADDDLSREKDGSPTLNEAGQPVGKDVAWARLQVLTRLKAAQMLDSERFVQAVKPDSAPLSDDGIAAVAKHLAGAFANRHLPGSTPHIPQDIESETTGARQ
jgi:hypothetical protein